jgi:hypothetical protein
MAGLFQVLWGKQGRDFKQAAVLNGTDGEPLIIPIKGEQEMTENICTRPMAVDWNADGKLDLVVGNFAGSFYVFTGQGGGRFAPKPKLLLTGGSRLNIQGQHSDPFPVDWDGDGDLDLLSGADQGGVQWAENTAGQGKVPELKPFTWLIQGGSHPQPGGLLGENDLRAPAGSTRVWVEDVNHDGKLDLRVGDNVTLVSLAKGVTKEHFEKRHAAWQKEIAAASEGLVYRDNKPPDQAAMKRYQDLYQERTKFMEEDRTGYVWLYLRK